MASPAWQRKEGKSPSGGLNKKGRASYKAMKDYYRGRAEEQNESIPGELDAMARTGGIPIHQDRKSTSSSGRDISVMADD
jgi:hypothetical protein